MLRAPVRSGGKAGQQHGHCGSRKSAIALECGVGPGPHSTLLFSATNLAPPSGGSSSPAQSEHPVAAVSPSIGTILSERRCFVFQQDLLKGRAIFLTGGGTGLGRSMAVQVATLGARLFLVGRREEPLKEVCAEIHRQGGASGYTICDVRDYDAVESAFASAELQFGEIDTLVNNAAGNFLARTERLTPNGFNAVVGIVLN